MVKNLKSVWGVRFVSLHQRLRQFAIVSSGAIAAVTVLIAQPVQAQKTSALPPPPDVNFDLLPVPAQPSGKPPATTPQEYIFKAPADNSAPTGKPERDNDRSQRYLVYVNGNSLYLLQQVQQAEPRAFIQPFRGQQVIQVGIFETKSNARQQAAMLAQQGIGTEVAAIAINRPNLRNGSGFIVIIPASQSDFLSLTEQITRLGIQRSAIQPNVAPVAPHLQIGPFAERQDAENASRSLRREGLDARVFYKR